METADLIKLLGGGGFAAALLWILWRVLNRIGERIVVAIDKVTTTVDDHTAKDLEHHGIVREDVGELRGDIRELRVEIAVTREAIARELDWERTPVHGTPITRVAPPERRRTPAQGAPSTYHVRRPGTKEGGDR